MHPKAMLDTPQIADRIQKGVNTFMEAVPPLVRALDEVAKVHPFIAGMIISADILLCQLTIHPV